MGFLPVTIRPLRAIANRATFGVYDETGTRICSINSALTGQREYAAMMAAAPDLYTALETAYNCLGDVAEGKGGWAWEEVLDAARAALEKARGETS